MKTTRLTLSVFLAVTAAAVLSAADPKTPSRVEVTFTDPEKFTDAADAQRGSDFGREANLQELRQYIERRATRFVPEGQKLSVTITDVDLAGEVEPWRTPRMSDARFVKDIYPPRIELSFRLTDASGAVIKEGTRKLSDLTFMMNLHAVNRDDPRIYEKDLLDRWISSEFRPNKK
ncbi:DUF3016 domain-containing protein [Opitutus terrae]|uniref:DUF3016 domain-containing protein n=1 Tax=Opitutus terrae (strain DSM 11246 / JCM 15787 / PB90-1) TaxID=452637 RepID=B1ZVL6_OPITP|nr:DUF3016 domain-containing protein [Opitutus terrae]ACB74113.1 conserved hypothetical protein [Opitutus terrae PB90-1]